MSKLEFGKFTEVTKKAKALFGAKYVKYGDYEGVYVCVDVENSWVCRILVGYDEDYKRDENRVILERNLIEEFNTKWEKSLDKDHDKIIESILNIDDLSNWDYQVCDSVSEAIEMIDAGFGIIEEVE